jgi:hypothetical protein
MFKSLSPIEKASLFVGVLGSLAGIAVWFIMVYFNPYSNGDNTVSNATVVTVYKVFLPAIAALVSSIFGKPGLMLIVFLWFLPGCLYMAGTPGIFNYFGLVEASYLVSAFLMIIGTIQVVPTA